MTRGETCAHPKSGNKSAWWMVDLGGQDPSQRFVVQEVEIFFRSDCCTSGKIYYIMINLTSICFAYIYIYMYVYICI